MSGVSHLIRYPSETDIRYARRNEVAWYTSDLKSACVRYAGYLSKQQPVRETGNPLFAAMIDDANWRGDSLDVFWQNFMVEAKARGCMLLLVDMPRAVPETQAGQIEQRAFPYLSAIKPEALTGWKTDARGFLTYAAINDTMEIDGQAKTVTREWDVQGWRVKLGGHVIESGEHGLGVCPVIAFSESGEFGESGEFAQIAVLSKRLFNLRSELDEILRSQTFSVLAFPLPDEVLMSFSESAAKISETIGTQNMLAHAQGSQPAFIAPPDGPAKVYEEVIANMESKIMDAGLNVQLPEGQESGLAMSLRFQALNSSLERFARRMEDFERRMWFVAARWLKVNVMPEISWNKNYALTDAEKELNELAMMQAALMPPETIREKQKQVVSALFGALPAVEMDALMAAIDATAQEQPAE